MSPNLLRVIQLFLASFNLGAICFVQVVHYPLFSDVPEKAFRSYHRKHVQKTTLLLGVTLTLELFLNFFIFFEGSLSVRESIPIGFLGVGWLTTFSISIPQHRKLEHGFNKKNHRILVGSNAVRVMSWGGLTAFLIGLFL